MLPRQSSWLVRLLPRVAALLATLALPTGTTAQETEEPRRFCGVGRPRPSCQVVLFAQFSYYPRIQRFSDLEAPYEWEIGALVNRGRADALGGTVVLGRDGNGFRTALKARYRRWIGRHAAMDAAGGLALAQRDGAPAGAARRLAAGVTGDAALGLTDWVSAGARGDLLWSHPDREPAGATYGMVRLGTRPGIVANLIGLALVAAFAGAL